MPTEIGDEMEPAGQEPHAHHHGHEHGGHGHSHSHGSEHGAGLFGWLRATFAHTRKGASRRFTYGYGKTEDVAGVVIVLIIFLSACVAAWESVRKILRPQPVQYLGWAAVAAIIGFLGNEAVAVLRIRVGTA